MTAPAVSPPRAQDAVMTATGLTKRYRSGVLAVDGVDLAVHRGEVYGFLGPNGAGKTTTMRMLLGLIRPAAGEVAVGITAGWLILGMWSTLGVLLGTLTRGTALAVGLGLVWALVVENLIRASAAVLDIMATVQRFLPGVNAGSLVAALGARGEGQGDGTPGVAAVVDGTQATVVLLGYLIAFALLAGAVHARRDVV